MTPVTANIDFATTLMERAENWLSDPSRRRRGHWLLWSKALVILLLYAWAYAQWLAADSTWAFLGWSLLIGLCHVLIPINIVHDAVHGAFSQNRALNVLGLLTMYGVGSDPFLYRDMHLRAHRDKEDGSRRKAIESQQLLMKQANRRNLPVAFYLLYALYMIFVREFVLLRQEDIRLSVVGWGRLIATKIGYTVVFWVFPFWVVDLPGWQVAAGILAIYVLISALLIVILLMPTDRIEVARVDQNRQLNDAWIKAVLENNVDFSPQSHTLNFLAGGTNMNVVHYLFPGVSHVHYVGLAEIIRETAAEYGLTYRQQKVGQVLGIHWRYMLELGRS